LPGKEGAANSMRTRGRKHEGQGTKPRSCGTEKQPNRYTEGNRPASNPAKRADIDEDVLDFFESVGTLYKRNLLNKELAASSFGLKQLVGGK